MSSAAVCPQAGVTNSNASSATTARRDAFMVVSSWGTTHRRCGGNGILHSGSGALTRGGARNGASAAELSHHGLPQRNRFAITGIVARLLAHGRVHHDEPALRIDEDRLAAHAEEREHPPLAREEPG